MIDIKNLKLLYFIKIYYLDVIFQKLISLYKELDNFKENIGNINLFYFNPYKVLCPTKNCNIYNINNRILTYRDNNHLTIEGSLLLKTEFDFFLQNNDIY